MCAWRPRRAISGAREHQEGFVVPWKKQNGRRPRIETFDESRAAFSPQAISGVGKNFAVEPPSLRHPFHQKKKRNKRVNADRARALAEHSLSGRANQARERATSFSHLSRGHRGGHGSHCCYVEGGGTDGALQMPTARCEKCEHERANFPCTPPRREERKEISGLSCVAAVKKATRIKCLGKEKEAGKAYKKEPRGSLGRQVSHPLSALSVRGSQTVI